MIKILFLCILFLHECKFANSKISLFRIRVKSEQIYRIILLMMNYFLINILTISNTDVDDVNDVDDDCINNNCNFFSLFFCFNFFKKTNI